MKKDERIELDTRSLQDRFVHCRTFGHSWKLGTVKSASSRTDQMSMHCTSCRATRIDEVRTTGRSAGTVAARRYIYPEGYLADRQHVAPSRQSFRFELIRRARARK